MVSNHNHYTVYGEIMVQPWKFGNGYEISSYGLPFTGLLICVVI